MRQPKPIRVLHVIDTDGLGGAQSLLGGIVGHPLSTNQHRIFAARRHAKPLLANSEDVKCYNSSSKFSLSPLKRLRTKLQRDEYDVVHCHLPRSLALGTILNVTMSSQTVFVAHEHGQILGSNDRTFLSDLAYCTLKRSTKFAFAHHVAVSDATRDALTNRVGVPDDQITVIPSFVDTSKYNRQERLIRRPQLRAQLNLTDDDFVIGIAGRITAKKGWRVFLDALTLSVSGDRVPVVIVTGDGPERPEFERAVAALPKSIHLHDLKWVDDIRDFYSLLDCFVAPSFAEGSPVAAREAMAVGLPVISSSADGFLDLIDDNETGLIFEVGNAASLSNLILLLLTDSRKADYLAQNAARKADEFSVEKYLSALDKVYRSCLTPGVSK